MHTISVPESDVASSSTVGGSRSAPRQADRDRRAGAGARRDPVRNVADKHGLRGRAGSPGGRRPGGLTPTHQARPPDCRVTDSDVENATQLMAAGEAEVPVLASPVHRITPCAGESLAKG